MLESLWNTVQHGTLRGIDSFADTVAWPEPRPWVEVLDYLKPIVARAVLRAARTWEAVSAETAEELCTEVLTRLFREERTLLEETRRMNQRAIISYIDAIAVSVVHKHYRASRNLDLNSANPGPLTKAEFAVLQDKQASDSLERRILLAEVDEILQSKLKGATGTRDRRIFWLHYRFGMTAKAISEIPEIGLPEKDVQHVLDRTLGLLQAELLPAEEVATAATTGRSGDTGLHGNPDLPAWTESVATPLDTELERYHTLVQAKHLGTITPQESGELAALDCKLAREAEEEADEFDRTYADSRASKFEAGLRKIDELLAELRHSRAGR